MNTLIYGKNPLERIVSIEPLDDCAEIFIENKDGKIETQFVKNRYWILADRQINKSFIRLKGDLNYKYGAQFANREEFGKKRWTLQQENEIFSIWDAKEALMVKDGYTYFKGMRHNEVSILAFDIEATGLKHDKDSKVLIISNTFRKNGEVVRKLFCYDEYETQGKMLSAWCEWVRSINPSVICGHNIFGYDLPYINFVADREGVALELGRDESPIRFEEKDSRFRKDQTQNLHYKRCHIYGRNLIDTMFLAIRYDAVEKKYESYGLKSIIAQEGLEVKDRQFYDTNLIRHNYKNPVEFEKIKKYALHDADDALSLYDLMSPALFYFTQAVPKSFQMMHYSATGSQLNAIMVRSYLQEMHSLPKDDPSEKFEGAISFGISGIYRNCLKIDVKSEYPSCILQYEIYDKKKDPNKNFYKMVEYFTEQRFENKRLAKETGEKYYTDMEQMQKIGINSAYGMLGAPGLLFNSPKNAALVTQKGREVIETAIKWASGQTAKYWLDKADPPDAEDLEVSENESA